MARQLGRMQHSRHHAQITGAENLLTTAIRALNTGDSERAGQLMQRAAQMPYDEREDESPGVVAASMLVCRLISDQFESSESSDTTWLDVVLGVYSDLDSSGRARVSSVDHGLVLQEAFSLLARCRPAPVDRLHGRASPAAWSHVGDCVAGPRSAGA